MSAKFFTVVEPITLNGEATMVIRHICLTLAEAQKKASPIFALNKDVLIHEVSAERKPIEHEVEL